MTGVDVPLDANAQAMLYALVMSRPEVLRDVLWATLPPARRKDDKKAVRMALRALRKALPVEIEGKETVKLTADPKRFQVDLWEFLDLVAESRYEEAHDIDMGPLDSPIGAAGNGSYWSETLEHLEAARAEVRAKLAAGPLLLRSIEETREELLETPVAPGVAREITIREVHEKVVGLHFRWRTDRPHGKPRSGPLAHYLSEVLGHGTGRPRRVIVKAGPGMGKTLTAKLTYLRLTEEAAEKKVLRPVLYLDATVEGSQHGFGSDEWFEQRLRASGTDPASRTVVILAHADSVLSGAEVDLTALLGGKMFEKHDILLCCSDQLYSRGLKYGSYATHVITLEPWTAVMQSEFAESFAGPEVRQAFETWRDEDIHDAWDTRERLCSVPLHLAHLLAFVADGSESLARISTRWHVFDQVAAVRLQKMHFGEAEAHACIRDLGSLAHRFYVAGESADRPIGFSGEELRLFLREVGAPDPDTHAAKLLDRTFLQPPGPASDEIHFEETSWGWYFVSWHLRQSLLEPDPPQRPLRAFSKFFSLEVMEIFKEMVREVISRHEEKILASLRDALFDDPGKDLQPAARSIAREQIGYLLGILGGPDEHVKLLPLLDPADAAWEPDPLVRRGIVVALANRGNRAVADRYVDRLREERESPPPHSERDANVQFLLGFHGAHPFGPARRPYAGQVDPSAAIADLVRGLEESHHLGSWRIKLFTLTDLASHPVVSPAAYANAVAVDRERLRRILDIRSRDESTRTWPELGELRNILDA